MSIKKRFNQQFALILGIAVSVLIAVCAVVYFSRDAIVHLTYAIQAESNITPIISLETGIGSNHYRTKSYQITAQGITETEPYERSFSKTFPSRALDGELWPKDERKLRETYGQLMAYYDTANGPAYLFEQPSQYILLYQGRQMSIPFTDDRSLFDFNGFDDHFYLFGYAAMDESTGDFGKLAISKYTMDLQPAGEYSVDLSQLGISCLQLANESMAVKNDTLFFGIQDDLYFYTVCCDLADGTVQKNLVRYQPICHVVREQAVYSLGTKGNRFVLEQLGADGSIIHTTEAEYPGGITPSFGLRRQWIYGNDATLYGCADDENGDPILFSYSLNSDQWTNWWQVDIDPNYNFADYHFVFDQNGSQIDLFPYRFS